MGMFDSVFIQVKCPFCGVTSEMECQTKEFYGSLQRWRKGDNTGHPEVSELDDCFVVCENDRCPGSPKAQSLYQPAGDKSFTIAVDAPLGLITGKYRLIGFEKVAEHL